MNRLQVSAVTPNRSFVVVDVTSASGGPDRMTVYSGVVTIVGNPGFKGIIRGTDVETLSFFVPDCPPVTRHPSHLEVETSVRSYRASTGDAGGSFVVGAVQPQVTVAPDPRGGAGPWLQVSFGLHPVGSEGCELNYRVSSWA